MIQYVFSVYGPWSLGLRHFSDFDGQISKEYINAYALAKPGFVACEQHRLELTCTSVQYDQCLCYLLS